MKSKKMILRTCYLLLALYSLPSFGQSLHNQVYDAQTAIEKKDWLAAEAILNPANAASPNNPHVLIELAQVYENTNRLKEAAATYGAIAKLPASELDNTFILIRSPNGIELATAGKLAAEGLQRTQAKLNQITSTLPAAPVASATVPATAAAPAVTPSAPALAEPPQTDQTFISAVAAALQKWASAWANKDLAAYHASYIDGFRGNQSSNASWKKSRQNNILDKKVIELDLTDVQITEISSNKAKVTFKQKYSADKLQESTNKVLMMSKVGGAWLIERETTQ